MTNKELRKQIYSWLVEGFQLDFTKINKERRNELKKILEEFNPTQETIKPQIKKEVVSEWKPYKG